MDNNLYKYYIYTVFIKILLYYVVLLCYVMLYYSNYFVNWYGICISEGEITDIFTPCAICAH